MLDLMFSVLLTGFIFLVFKGFEKYEIDNLQAIIVNYVVAFSIGFMLSKSDVRFQEIPDQSWFLGVIFLGVLFVSVFNLLALTTQKYGFSIVSVASKMSLVIPVLFAVYMYGDVLDTAKIIGLLFALLAVYFITKKKSKQQKFDRKHIYFPLLLFIGAGVLDTLLKYIETTYVSTSEFELYTASIFMMAGGFGLFFLMIKQFFLKRRKPLSFKTIIAGIALGVPNYFSVYYLLKALKTQGISSAAVFTVNNVAVVLLATIIGVLFFKEQLSKTNWLGALLAIVALLLFYF